MKKVEIVIIRSDGQKFVIDNTTWMIPSNGLSGFGAFDNEIKTENNAIGDGAIIVSERMPRQDRTVKFEIVDRRNNELLRQDVQKFFNPKMRYKVYITYMEVTRWCEGSLYKFAMSENNVYKRLTVQFTVLCPDPFMNSNDNLGKDIAQVVGMTGFPYLCASIGTPTGVYAFGENVYLENNGDVTTYCSVKIVAKGDVVNPKFVINGKYVRLIDTLKNSDVVVIDFQNQPPTVRKNGVNIIGKCDRTSSFNDMGFIVGTNVISYSADTGDSNMEVSVSYYQKYSAI